MSYITGPQNTALLDRLVAENLELDAQLAAEEARKADAALRMRQEFGYRLQESEQLGIADALRRTEWRAAR